MLTAIPFVFAVIAAASMGMLFPTGEWYRGLNKPSWTPPNWLFPIAWTLLYIGIAIAGWRVATSTGPLVTTALAFWALQITLNAIWTPAVFGARNLFIGLLIIIALWVAILITTILNFQVDVISGVLFVPYLIWVSYATALNFALFRSNV